MNEIGNQLGIKFSGASISRYGAKKEVVAVHHTGSYVWGGVFRQACRNGIALTETQSWDAIRSPNGETYPLGMIGSKSKKELLLGFYAIRDEKHSDGIPFDCPDIK